MRFKKLKKIEIDWNYIKGIILFCAVVPPVALIIIWPSEYFTWKDRLAAIAGVCITIGLVVLFGSGSDMPWGRPGDYRP